MSDDRLQRSKSDPPPPITVEDTTTGATSQHSDSPEQIDPPTRSFTTVNASATQPMSARPPLERGESQPQLHQKRQATLGHRRKHSPNIEWREKWTKETWKQGRVLLIDYVDQEHTAKGKRKIVAQEFCDIDGLRRFYRKEELAGQAALRVIHVQNASWATRFLLRKFNIDASDDLVGTNFGRWARYERPQHRRGKPVLNGKTFRTQRDPWRGISRTAFGCDYLKHYPRSMDVNEKKGNGPRPMMELNHYDETDQPCYGFDVHVQRLSCYVQMTDGKPGMAVDPDIPNPYDEEAYEEYQRLKKQYGNVDANEHQERYIPKLRSLDNGNTIIIFENSTTGSVKDTLVGARQELESRWRRLTFYLTRESLGTDEMLVTECMNFILKDIFKAVAYNWNKFLSTCETHVGILEDKIYDNPADESRASELWENSAQWLKVERLLYLHVDVVKEMRTYMHELAVDRDPLQEDDAWLGSIPDEIEKLTGQWERDIMAPTTGLSDLMYKSVGIRDARHSLQLGLSMWRLSWITFIFLPLTFTVGFFGMNVDTFAENPPIKWWFISSFPILFVVLILWYAVKHNLSTQRQNPLRRGVYEAFYHELATDHHALWTRRGPRPDIVPVSWWDNFRWRLVTTWFDADKLVLGQKYNPATEEFGSWSRTKRYLVRRWLGEIAIRPSADVASITPDANGSTTVGQNKQGDITSLPNISIQKDLGAVEELLAIATPVAIAEFDPTAASRLQQRLPIERLRSLSPTRSDGRASPRPPSSDGGGSSSGVMVEEKGNSGDEMSGGEGSVSRAGRPGVRRNWDSAKGRYEREEKEERERDRRRRLNVPFSM